MDALQEATAMINADKRAAAQGYLRISKDKDSVENILAMLEDPNITFTMTPQNVMKYADFMHRVGSIKVKPASWKELFFPDIHDRPGS
jgi:NitT/TauT family transport system substrate-binding protein